MRYHNCRDSLCDTPHGEHEDYCECDDCHQWHCEDGIENHWHTCSRCTDIVQEDIERNVRCRHGNVLPGITPDGFITDEECIECQIDYGPSLYAFDGTWSWLQEQTINLWASHLRF